MTIYNVSILTNIVTQVVGGRGRRVAFKLSGQYSLDQALCLGENSEERGGKGVGGRACRQTFEAAISPSCNYRADHLSVRSLSVNQFHA